MIDNHKPGIGNDWYGKDMNSDWQDWRNASLIDGVAINGVRGGPVVVSNNMDGVQTAGSITAHCADRATGEALPGLSFAQDISHFQASASRVKTMEEAERQKKALRVQEPKQTSTSIDSN